MTRGEADKAVRERWAALGIGTPERYPHVFNSDVENKMTEDVRRSKAFAEWEAAYRKQVGESGRSVPQYSDPAGGE